MLFWFLIDSRNGQWSGNFLTVWKPHWLDSGTGGCTSHQDRETKDLMIQHPGRSLEICGELNWACELIFVSAFDLWAKPNQSIAASLLFFILFVWFIKTVSSLCLFYDTMSKGATIFIRKKMNIFTRSHSYLLPIKVIINNYLGEKSLWKILISLMKISILMYM